MNTPALPSGGFAADTRKKPGAEASGFLCLHI